MWINDKFFGTSPYRYFNGAYRLPSYEGDDAKDSLIQYLVLTKINELSEMFRYKNLPPKIPERILKLNLMFNGYTAIFKLGDDFYCSYGTLGGLPDYNYMPTECIISNPYLKISSNTYKIGETCAIIPNDPLYMGMLPTCYFYAPIMAESVISRRLVTINYRAMNTYIATTNDEMESINKYQKDLEKGKASSIMSKQLVSDGVHEISTESRLTRALTDLIENEQYTRAIWANACGQRANYNMKREAIGAGETAMAEGNLVPSVDSMFDCQKEHIEICNELFGLNIKIEKGSSWEDMQKDLDLAQKAMEEEVKSTSQNDDSEKSNQLDSEKEGESNEKGNAETDDK